MVRSVRARVVGAVNVAMVGVLSQGQGRIRQSTQANQEYEGEKDVRYFSALEGSKEDAKQASIDHQHHHKKQKQHSHHPQ